MPVTPCDERTGEERMALTISMIVKFLKIVYTGMLKNCWTQQNQILINFNILYEYTHQALASCIYYTNEQKTDRKPCLCVSYIEGSERDDPNLLHCYYTCNAHDRLNTQQQEIHGEVDARYDKLVQD